MNLFDSIKHFTSTLSFKKWYGESLSYVWEEPDLFAIQIEND